MFSSLRNAARQGVSQAKSKAHEIQDKIHGNNPAKQAVQTTLLKARGMSTDGAKQLLNGQLPSSGPDKLRGLMETVTHKGNSALQGASSKVTQGSNAASSMSKKYHDISMNLIGNLKA